MVDILVPKHSCTTQKEASKEALDVMLITHLQQGRSVGWGQGQAPGGELSWGQQGRDSCLSLGQGCGRRKQQKASVSARGWSQAGERSRLFL